MLPGVWLSHALFIVDKLAAKAKSVLSRRR